MSTPHLIAELSAADLRVSYDKVVALDIPALEVQSSVLAVVGHNGAGKSTLIKSILGLLPPRSGSLAVARIESELRTPLFPERDMAFCPETGAVFSDITVESYIRFWCRVRHGDARYHIRHGEAIIEALQVAPLLPRLGRELSKGQRRRVQTAIGFLLRPRLFLFDEPFDGLDVQKTAELAEIIHQQRHQTAFIISSHRMDVMERLADQALVLKQGRVLCAGGIEPVCRALCPVNVTIRNLSAIEQVHSLLVRELASLSVTRLGDNLTVCGNELDLNRLQTLVAGVDRNGALIERSRASLTDAMGFHLRELGRSGAL